MKDNEDGRDVGRIWTSFIYIALHQGIKTDHRGADLDLAFLIHEANAMRIVARAACLKANISYDELLEMARSALAKRATKVARKAFEKKRQRWDEIMVDQRGQQ